MTLMVARGISAFSLIEPLQIQASGDEPASLFGIWKVTKGQAVYADRFQPPFALNVYNWLFYYGYGSVIRFVQWMTGLGDSWQPTIGRMLTVLSMAVGVAIVYATLVFREAIDTALHRRLCLALAVFLFTGPLIGFWSFSVRPDIWVLAMEAAAVGVFLWLYPDNRIAAVLGFAVVAYIAWSLKHTGIMACGAVGLFLVVRREWKLIVVLVAAMSTAWGATLGLGGQLYWETIFTVGHEMHYSLEMGIRNLTNAGVKTAPLWVMAAVFIGVLSASPGGRRRILDNDKLTLAISGIVVTTVLTVAAGTQTYGGEHYYFASTFFLAFGAVAAISVLIREQILLPRWATGLASAAWLAVSLAIVAVFFGLVGRLDLGDQHRNWTARARCLNTLPSPLFVYDRYLSLPWMTPGNTPYVLSFYYELDRAHGRQFTGDGIGGAISRGEFATIAVSGEAVPESLDGASLADYSPLSGYCPGITVLIRKGVALPTGAGGLAR